MKISIIQRQLG